MLVFSKCQKPVSHGYILRLGVLLFILWRRAGMSGVRVQSKLGDVQKAPSFLIATVARFQLDVAIEP
jgi:hypothetical protein